VILLLTPPFVQLNTPYPATPVLAGFLRSRGYAVEQRDLSLETALEMLRTYGDGFTDEAIEILQNTHLPDEAKERPTVHIDRLAAKIRRRVDPDFGFSRYAERLGACVSDFGVVLKRLRRRSAVDRILEARVDAALAETRPDVVGVTCPFPGTLLGAFRIAQRVRKIAPHVRIVLGGGYVNTELRDLDDKRVGRFFDAVMYDEGFAPWIEFLEDGKKIASPVFTCPTYAGLDLASYIDLPESTNPMHRLWSTGRWLKLQLARGCYWRKCAFCDVTLDYIRCFAMPKAAEIVDAMERLARETKQKPRFHFTDEAIPPALAKAVSEEILRRKFPCEWWGNIRFDSAYTPALTRLMARAGCIAVSGGLECADDRLLKLMNKGITRASAKKVLGHFARAGILVHAYLMYAFPTETEREARWALAYVRNLFKEGLVQSAFFHRFALTVHSPVAAAPKRFGIIPYVPKVPRGKRFALNEIPFDESCAPDWNRIGKALKLALYNYMQGRGFSKPIRFWFDAV